MAELRRQIQYAADAAWPATKKVNAGVRTEFKLSPDRALKGGGKDEGKIKKLTGSERNTSVGAGGNACRCSRAIGAKSSEL